MYLISLTVPFPTFPCHPPFPKPLSPFLSSSYIPIQTLPSSSPQQLPLQAPFLTLPHPSTPSSSPSHTSSPLLLNECLSSKTWLPMQLAPLTFFFFSKHPLPPFQILLPPPPCWLLAPSLIVYLAPPGPWTAPPLTFPPHDSPVDAAEGEGQGPAPRILGAKT